jgi:pyruvate dehydrogenase E1 component alpha subunit
MDQPMRISLASLYRQMLRSRRFEEAVKALWEEGLISGEMHLGIGEEAVVAGIVAQLRDEDALALDHRGTPALVMRGVDLTLLLKEFLGCPDGLCSGRGGHMHLFSRAHLAASSGIVGSAGPLGAGFALSAQMLRPESAAVAFFGDGAMNQGMLLESFNLAAAWKLPLVFVCKDNGWAVSTRSESVTGGNLADRAKGFGLPVLEAEGTDVEAVRDTALEAFTRARQGGGPSFLLARCPRMEGHFLGDPLLKAAREPARQIRGMAIPLVRSVLAGEGASRLKRLSGLGSILASMGKTAKERWDQKGDDPVEKAEKKLEKDHVLSVQIKKDVDEEIRKALEAALEAQ